MTASNGDPGSAFDLADAVDLARRALAEGFAVALGVVVEAPEDRLVGRRVAWDGDRIRGTLGEPEWDDRARRALVEAGSSPATVTLGETGIEVYVERVTPPDELVIVGAGHIAQPLSTIGHVLGLRVLVLDDRPGFARRDRFPDADRVVVTDFDAPFREVGIGLRSHVVLVTRGHRYDYDCLRALAGAGVKPAYVGMIGSRRRVRAAFEALAAEGFGTEDLRDVFAPIGLDIGAETPEEIALAIAAEIVLARRGGCGRPLRDVTEVVRYVKTLSEEAR